MGALAKGTVLSGRYVVGKLLGAGGMGEVYEAVQQGLDRKVAIKTLASSLAGDPELFERFKREAQAAAAIGHPNIVQVIDFHNDQGAPPYLVMEHLEGRSLFAVIMEHGTLLPERASFIALQVLSALAAAHGAGIIHRDIKPSNVHVVPTLAVPDFVKVLDFGLAKLTDEARGPLTVEGAVLGTSGYMAPEQARGEAIDARVDVFATGALLFHALSGRKPRHFQGVEAAQRDACRPLREVAPHVSAELAAVVDRALAFDPKDRWASAEEMARALEASAGRAAARVVAPTAAARTEEIAAPTMSAPPTVSGPPSATAVPPTSPVMGTVPYAAPVSQQPPRSNPYAPQVLPTKRRSWWPLWLSLAFVPLGLVVALVITIRSITGVNDELRIRYAAAVAQATPCPPQWTCSGTYHQSYHDDLETCAKTPQAKGDVHHAPGTLLLVQRPDRDKPILVRVTSEHDGVYEADWFGSTDFMSGPYRPDQIVARVCKEK